MYIHTGKRNNKKVRGKTNKLKAKQKAKNRRRVRGMQGRRLSARR